MTKLLGILDTITVHDKSAIGMARNMAKKAIIPWSEELHKKFIRLNGSDYCKELDELGYVTYPTMDYKPVEQMPEERTFLFHSLDIGFGRYFSDDLQNEPKIVLPGQPDENLTSIVLGKRPVWTPKGEDIPIEDSVYIYIQSGADRMPGRIKAVKGNEEFSTPILYASINERIHILIPKNLTYQQILSRN